MTTTITIAGLKPLLEKLEELGKGKYIDPVLPQVGQAVRNALAPYPPKPAGSTYRRTGRLGQSWFVTPTAQMSVEVKDTAPYAMYVQGDWQTAKHASTGWKVLSRTVESMRAEIVEKVARAVHRILAQ